MLDMTDQKASAGRGIKLYTYDVFDTCIIRNVYRPTHIHWLTARQMTPAALLCSDAEDWRKLRVDAETACRALIGNGEILLADIYAEIGRRRPIPGDALARAQQTEIEIELRSVRPNEWLRSLITTDGRSQTAYVSDSYLSRALLEQMLRSCNFPNATMFVSSEKQRTKREGGLFGLVSAAQSVSPPEIKHLGDNKISDVVRARAAGFQAAHYSQGGFTRFETRLYEAGGEDDRASRIAGAARAARLSHNARSATDSVLWRVSCDVAGPILTAFVLWIVLKSVSEGRKRIYFLARDGQILAKIADAIIAWGQYDVKAVYMLASRQALHTASLPTDFAAAISEILARGKTKTVGEVLRELETPLDEIDAMFSGSTLLPGSSVANHDAELSAILNCHRGKIENLTQRRRAGYRAYLASIGFTGLAEELLVDLGWHGNLQARVYQAVPEASRNVPGFYFSLRSFPKQIEDQHSIFLPFSPAISAILLETFCMATHGSIIGIEKGVDGALTTLTKPFGQDGPVGWKTEDQQTAILAFTGELLRAFSKDEASDLLTVLTRAGIASLEEFRVAPDHDEATVFGSVVHASDQSHIGAEELAPHLSVSDFLTRSPRFRAGTRYWRYGVLFRSSPPRLVDAYQLLRRTALALNSPSKAKRALRSVIRRLTGR